MTRQSAHIRPAGRRNRWVALVCAGLVCAMVGLAYASVPLYRLFCQVTGYGGTTQVSAAGAGEILADRIAVRFDANVSRGLNWSFTPNQRVMELNIGESRLATYQAVNHGEQDVTGTATFNVTPEWAGRYFNKIECFCFTEQKLKSGEQAELPVAFFVDPDIVKDRAYSKNLEITLSYTFFAVDEDEDSLAKAVPAGRPAAGPNG